MDESYKPYLFCMYMKSDLGKLSLPRCGAFRAINSNISDHLDKITAYIEINKFYLRDEKMLHPDIIGLFDLYIACAKKYIQVYQEETRYTPGSTNDYLSLISRLNNRTLE